MKPNQDIRLLPSYFKKIAFGVMTLCLVIMVLQVSEVISFERNAIGIIVKSGILISLLLLAITRSKMEDELTLRIRLRAFTLAFVYGVGIVIVEPFVDLFFSGRIMSEMGVSELLISMFLFYFGMMALMKRTR